jgi:hypothetical protein
MTRKFAAAALVCLLAVSLGAPPSVQAGQPSKTAGYKALAPITQGNLTIFPVVAATSYDTSGFLTLDEGVRRGEVVITEAGNVAPPLIRGPVQSYRPNSGAQVNTLVLVNKSKRPLLLLAGEIVTGGKQDRVIAKDRIVPSGAEPIELSVFCVEPGRWTARTDKFGSLNAAMAQPSVRKNAMGAQASQQQVWAEVGRARTAAMKAAPATAGVGGDFPGALTSTTSYARVMESDEVKRRIDSVAEPIVRSYQAALKELRERNAVGVVVAVNGEIIWADVFASTALLEQYWPKLARSYAAQAVLTPASSRKVEVGEAQKFLDELEGKRELVESEPGVFRQAEITGDGYKVFELTSLLPKLDFDLHLAKMAQ